MKYLFIILFLSTTFTFMLFGQEESLKDVPLDISESIEKMGNDSSPIPNACECKYLDYFFQKTKGTFSFCGKKIFFLTGNTGTIKSNKKEYFWEKKFTGTLPSLPTSMEQLIIFDELEAKNIGYDVVIVSGSKKYLTKNDIMKRIKGKN